MAKVSKEQMAANAERQARTDAVWGIERQPFESDVSYYVRAASHWRDKVMNSDVIGVPSGYRIERDESNAESMISREVVFHVIETGEGFTEGVENALTKATARYDRRADYWYVNPGSNRNSQEPAEARARAAALIMAADECEARNAQASD